MVRDSSSRVDWQLLTPLLVTILIAVSGYVYSHQSQLASERRAARVARLNDQLRYLYGPLYSFSNVTYKTWLEFRKQSRPEKQIGAYWDDENPPDETDKEAYRRYMVEVVQPYQVRIEAALLEYSDLIDEAEMPEVLLVLAANIAESKSLYAAWQRGDFSKHQPNTDYPVELDRYARDKFIELKSRQLALLGSSEMDTLSPATQ